MHQSSLSYRSNKYSAADSRKILGNSNANPLMQQQHIEDLERKVDVILLHNQTLIDENANLKRLLDSNRHSSADSELFRLRKELETQNMRMDQIVKQHMLEKDRATDELEEMNLFIRKLTASLEKISEEKAVLEDQLEKYEYQKERENHNLREELQNEVYENSLKKELEHKDELRDIERKFLQQIEEMETKWADEKTSIEDANMERLLQMEKQYETEKEDAIRKLQEQQFDSVKKIQMQADEKCRSVREKSEKYLREALINQKRSEEEEMGELKEEIDGLRSSLQARQKVIEGLLLQGVAHFQNDKYYEEVQSLRKRIKELTQGFFKQSELLKVKMALKHQADVREVAKVYDDRIDVIGQRINLLQNENERLRENYENEIRSKMKQRHKFQIDVSKLKNIIRKMKIELEGYGKQLRLNIEDMKSQANSFSMSMLAELGQEKNKKNFYEEEIRKMREVMGLKDKEMDSIAAQCEEKITYYVQKCESVKERLEESRQQLEEKDELHRLEMDSEKQHSRDELDKHKDHWFNMREDFQREVKDLKEEISITSVNLNLVNGEKKRLQADLRQKDKQLESAKAHIDAMNLEMEMLAQGEDPSVSLIPLKKHYERIIEEMKEDKLSLQEANSAQAEQISKIVAKYKILERSLGKTLSKMKKKSELENRVMQLGLDENLVKNLGQIFCKEALEEEGQAKEQQ